MKKGKGIVLMTLVVAAMLFGTVMAGMQVGPAPNAGDCIPDDSGLESPLKNGKLNGETPGPAPHAGDGIPDGSGW